MRPPQPTRPAPAPAVDLLERSALEQAALVRAGQVSSDELTRLYLARIARLDGALHAFVSVFTRRALAAARAKDRDLRAGRPLPPFHGVPIGIKDLNLVRWTRTRFGTRGLRPVIAPFDDHTVAALRRGGFVILGKLATSELGAMPVTEPDGSPPTRNPWDLGRTAGGSSGGSAAAVAAGLAPVAQGSDGAGSIRIPSAFCGLYGLKPSRGRVRNAYGRPDERSLYSCGPIARDVLDAAAMLDVLAGVGGGTPHRAPPPPRPFVELAREPPRPLRVALLLRSTLAEAEPEIVDAVRTAARVLERHGHAVEERPPPEGRLEEFLPLWQRLIADIPRVRWERTQPITEWLAGEGRALARAEVDALHRRLERRIVEALGAYDLWVTPTVPVAAPPVGSYDGMPPPEAFARAAVLGSFTAMFNVTGQPAASAPLRLTRAGLPVGVQIAGRLHREADVLAASHLLEQELPWRGRHPPGWT